MGGTDHRIASIVAGAQTAQQARKENAGIRALRLRLGMLAVGQALAKRPAKRIVEARWTKKHGRSHYVLQERMSTLRPSAQRAVAALGQAPSASPCDATTVAGSSPRISWPQWGQHRPWASMGGQRLSLGGASRRRLQGEGVLRSLIHRKARRNKRLLGEREKQGNKTRSSDSLRVRVEHVPSGAPPATTWAGQLAERPPDVGVWNAGDTARIVAGSCLAYEHPKRHILLQLNSPRRGECDNVLRRVGIDQHRARSSKRK